MYIRSLRLQNIKLLSDQELSFVKPNGSVRLWTVLLGDNGTCKTTILQAIALASSGDRLARKLVDDAEDYVCRLRIVLPAIIHAYFEADKVYDSMLFKFPGKHAFGDLDSSILSTDQDHHAFRGSAVSLTDLRNKTGKTDGQILNDIRDERRPGFFIVGYGVGRRLPKRGEVAIPRDPVADRIEGLFDSHHKMLGIDFFDALKEKNLHLSYAEAIKKVLLARDSAGEPLFPWLENLELSGEDGVSKLTSLLESRRFVLNFGGSENISLAPHQLSQGYQSTFSWIADLLGHAFLEQGAAVDPSEMRGIALLDEIDLHLHPTWQRRIVPILKTIFPQMQFIVTTHSPLVLTGFEADEIIKLEFDGDRIAYKTFQQQPGMQSGSELMENFFDVPTAMRPELLKDQRKLAALLAHPPTSAETQEELDAIQQKLAPYLQSTHTKDVLAPEQISDAESGDLDRAQWLKDVEAMKKQPTPDFTDDDSPADTKPE